MSDLNYPTASLFRRLAAFVYDGLIVIALYILLGGLFITAISKLMGAEQLIELTPAPALTMLFVICFFYYSHSWLRGGQTVGMKAWQIKLVNENPRSLQVSQCMLRTGTGFFSIILFGAGFWWILIDKQHRTWHDIASLTRVVHIPK
ncbi:MAG: RDD family protein [Bacterioplanes sp.]|nr:RDD family protein [Bacterioplanes sp.]